MELYTENKNEDGSVTKIIGVDIEENFYSENNSEYFFLRRIQEKVDFLSEYLNNK